jgi:pyrimidine deaminase RibD-like protein
MTPAIQNLIKRALDASEQSLAEAGKTSPPPKVGAAILFPDGEVVTGFRGQTGPGHHAEYGLLETLVKGRDLSGCVLATTLEPCTDRNHPKIPCCDRILAAGIKEVWVGTLDPNPVIYGCGCRKLRNSGVNVSYFLTQERVRASDINREFMGLYSRSPALEGTATFDYEKNQGQFILGSGDFEFVTRWSKVGDDSILASNDQLNISPSDEAEIPRILQSDHLDFTTKSMEVHTGEIFIARNKQGKYAAIRVLEIVNRKSRELSSRLKIEYRITRSVVGNFSSTLDAAFELEQVGRYDRKWAEATIAKELEIAVCPVLCRVFAPLEFMQSQLSSLIGPRSIWNQVRISYAFRTRAVTEKDRSKTFEVMVTRTIDEEESI